MSGYWLDILLVSFLVALNAAFAGSEMALVSLREGQLKQLERQGGARGLRLVRLARDSNRFLATIQIGITLAGFLASATAAVSLAEPLVPHLGVLGGAAEPVAVGGLTLILTFATLVFGELAPKRLAMQRALPWALAVAKPLDVLSTISRPVVAVLSATTQGVVRLLGGKAATEVDDISPQELRHLVSSHRELNDEQRQIISGALEIHERMLREVLVPRGSVFTLRADSSITDARAAMARAGHSRVPVVSGHHLDSVVGIVHWGTVIEGGDGPVGSVATEAMVLPDTVRVTNALQRFKSDRQQMAIVVDEHGSVDGIVTLEDLLEEIVGEIWDETDVDILGVQRSPDGSILLPGTFPIHDLPDIGVELVTARSGDYTTIAGLVVSRLGRLPEQPGDIVEIDDWQAEVIEVGHHAVTRVRLTLFREEPVAGE